MNNLSYLIYFLDVYGKISNTFFWLLIVITAFTFLYLFVGFCNHASNLCEYDSRHNPFQYNKAREFFDSLKHPRKIMWLPALILGVCLLFMPSMQTIYMIVASEAGEMVFETPEAQALLADLQEILQAQLNNLKGVSLVDP